MKKIIFITLLTLVLKSCSNKHEEYHENGQLKETGFIEEEKKIGEWKEYTESGQLYIVENYKKGKREGKRKQYYKNGNIMLEYSVKEDRLIGEWKQYYENGQIETEGTYGENREKDKWMTLFKDKQPIEIIFKKGEKKCKISFGSGSAIYINSGGIEKGTEKWKANYKEGRLFQIPKKQGEWRYYYKQGEIEKEEIHNKKNNAVLECEYYKNGQLKQIVEVYYIGGIETYFGNTYIDVSDSYDRETYSENGEPTKKEYFTSTGHIYEDYKNGYLIERTIQKNKNDYIIEKYENGHLAQKKTRTKKAGYIVEDYINGHLTQKNTYNKDGYKRAEYYKNGQLKEIAIHKKRNHIVIYKTYSRKGKLIRTRKHRMGGVISCSPRKPKPSYNIKSKPIQEKKNKKE